MNDLISVIVPVYNVAAYLPQCLDSILSQDHEALEVLLVDDGSTDHSGAICDEYGAKDSRVHVIHQPNGGAAAAKNAALRAASGDYLSFVDSDDFLQPEVYGYMLEVLKTSGGDAGEFAFQDVYRNRVEEQVHHPGRHVLDGKEYLLRFTQSWTCALLWNKLYKRSLFDGVFFEEGHKIDDEYFTYQGFLRARKVVCDDRIIYNYRRRASSVMLAPATRGRLIMDRADALSKRRETVAHSCPQLRKAFDTEFLDALIYMSQYPDNSLESLAFLQNKLKAYLIHRGNTLPPKRFWRGLGKLLLTSPEKLLTLCDAPEADMDIENYFR